MRSVKNRIRFRAGRILKFCKRIIPVKHKRQIVHNFWIMVVKVLTMIYIIRV